MTDLFGEEHAERQVVDLRSFYPIAFRSVFYRSLHWLIGGGILMVAVSYVVVRVPEQLLRSGAESPLLDAVRVISLTVLGLLGLKLLYEILRFKTVQYSLESDHLVISEGIISRTRASFALAKINDVYVRRNIIEAVFGLRSLTVLTPGPVSDYATIIGLPPQNAHKLQRVLLTLTKRSEAGTDGAGNQSSARLREWRLG